MFEVIEFDSKVS